MSAEMDAFLIVSVNIVLLHCLSKFPVDAQLYFLLYFW